MTRPSKFDLMRSNRAPRTPEQRARKLAAEMERLEREMTAEWQAPRRQFAYEQNPQLFAPAKEVDMDAVYARRQRNTTPRWWWPLARRTS